MKQGCIIFSIGFSFLLCSCHANKKLYGVHETEANGVLYIKLYLNEDNSFVEYINSHHWGPERYFGFYEKKGNYIRLKQISGDLSYLNKKDTIIYNYEPLDTANHLYVYRNERMPLEKSEVYADGVLVGITGDGGHLTLPKYFKCDSLVIKNVSGIGKKNSIRNEKFSQLFIMLYDYTFEPLTNFDFENRFRITSNGLLTTQTYLINVSGEKKEKKYLRLRKVNKKRD